MNYYEIRFAWNAQAEDGDIWHNLREYQKVEWAARLGAAAERAARQKAQEEVVALKERIARAGVEHRRALYEALQQERDACAKVAEGFPENRDWVPSNLWGNIRKEIAAAIRARQ